MLRKTFCFGLASLFIVSSSNAHELHTVVEDQSPGLSIHMPGYEAVKTNPIEAQPQSTKVTKRELVMAGVGLTLLTIYAIYEFRFCFGENAITYGNHCQMPSFNATLDDAFATCCTEYKGADGNLTSQVASWCREVIDNCTCESQDGHGRGRGFMLIPLEFQGCDPKEILSKLHSNIPEFSDPFTYFDFYRIIGNFYDIESNTITRPSVNFFNDTVYQALTKFCTEGLMYLKQPISDHLTGTYLIFNRTNVPSKIYAWPLCLEKQCVASHVDPAQNSLCPNGSWSLPLTFSIFIYLWFSYAFVSLYNC